jgi:hypothetical protein
MADLFLHLSFARRLRLAEGLHPLIGEALARRPSLVALGATLPLLPGLERQGMSFFRRLFAGGGESARWQKLLQAQSTPRVGLVSSFLTSPSELGQMARLALSLGCLSHELLESRWLPLLAAVSPSERAGVERAQARLWLQQAIPNTRDLEAEWQCLEALSDAEQHRRSFDHVHASLKAMFSTGPGRDTCARWARGLAAHVAPLAPQGLPPSAGLADHTARGPWFDQVNALDVLHDVTQAFVVVANRLGALAGSHDGLTPSSVQDALGTDGGALLERRSEGPPAQAWTDWLKETRQRALARGRNERPAFVEPPPTSDLHVPGAMGSELPPELPAPSLPPVSVAASPPVPLTQEISLAQIEAARSVPPLPVDSSGPMPAAPSTPPEHAVHGAPGSFVAPIMTQEISLAEIESAAASFPAPTHTQEVSLAQIEQAAHSDDPPRE